MNTDFGFVNGVSSIGSGGGIIKLSKLSKPDKPDKTFKPFKQSIKLKILAKAEAAKAVVARAEAARESARIAAMECFLYPVTHDSFRSMMMSFLGKFRQWFTEPHEAPDDEGEIPNELQTMLPVLLISLHGGLPVLRSSLSAYNYKTFTAQSEFYRLIKTPNGCCSLILPDVRQQYYDAVTKILRSFIDQNNIDPVIKAVQEQLLNLSFDLQKDCLPIKTTKTIERSIFKCRKQAFEIVNTIRNDNVINKLWTTDVYKPRDEEKTEHGEKGHNLAPRGILFCNTVVITVPNKWTIAQYNMSRFGGVRAINPETYEFNNQQYKIGIVNNRQIRYSAGTNLLSCPYFMKFASELLGDDIITLNNSLSLGKNNIYLIPMVSQITAQVLYRFLCKQKFLSIDMSCESLMIYDNDGKYIQDIATVQLKTRPFRLELQKLYNIAKKGVRRLRGGNCKSRCNTKKYNTKKCKKRGNTKTKKYKKRNMSQKQG